MLAETQKANRRQIGSSASGLEIGGLTAVRWSLVCAISVHLTLGLLILDLRSKQPVAEPLTDTIGMVFEAPAGRPFPFLHDRLVVVAGLDLPRPCGGAMPAVVRGADPGRSWTLAGPNGPVTLAVDAVLRLSSLVMIRDAMRAEAEVGRLPLSLVLHEVASGRLANWGDVAGSEIALWALYPSRRLLNARVSAFLDLLRQSFPKATPEELAAYLGR